MMRKNKPRNPLSFRTNAHSGAKCCEMRKVKKRHETWKKWRKIPCYTLLVFFAFCDCFRVFCDKCIAGLKKINFSRSSCIFQILPKYSNYSKSTFQKKLISKVRARLSIGFSKILPNFSYFSKYFSGISL